ncbi:hypothetical protein D3C78_1416550 [compost metagenome]
MIAREEFTGSVDRHDGRQLGQIQSRHLIRGEALRQHDQAINLLIQQRLNVGNLALGLGVSVAKDQVVVHFPECVFDAPNHFGVEGVGDVTDD